MIVGVDIGTQSLKAVIVTPDLEILGTHAIAYQPEFPRAGWAEQNPRLWEEALGPAIAGALAVAKCIPKDVRALGVAGQLDGCIAVDRYGDPIYPCLIWMDRRADAEIADIDAALIQQTCGVVLDASHLAAKIRWLKRHVAEVQRAPCFHVPVSYMVSRLTGANVIDHATASTSMVYGLAAQDYDDTLLTLFGIGRRELPAPRAAQSLAGALSSAGNVMSGLPEGIPVAVGTGDDFSSALGAGLTRPGRLIDVLAPTDYARFTEGLYGGWNQQNLFECVKGYICNEEQQRIALAHQGLSYRILLPIQVGTDTQIYTFIFNVSEVEILKQEPLPKDFGGQS